MSMVPELLAAAVGRPTATPAPAPLQDISTETEILDPPLDAKRRAEKVRKLLHEAWRRHVSGTPFGGSSFAFRTIELFQLFHVIHYSAEGRLQMYRAVNVDGAPPFEWRDDVAQAPFTNAAATDPRVSPRLSEYLSPLAHELRGHRCHSENMQTADRALPATDAGAQAPEDSSASQMVNRGPGSEFLVRVEPQDDVLGGPRIPENSTTLEMLIGQTHPDEPFRSFIPCQVAELKGYMERFGDDRLAAYASMRLHLSGSCFSCLVAACDDPSLIVDAKKLSQSLTKSGIRLEEAKLFGQILQKHSPITCMLNPPRSKMPGL